MAAGVPVVGFKWGGQVEIIREAYDGFLVNPNDIANLAMAIEGAFHDRELMSAHARERAAEYSWERAASSYADLFREVIQKKAVSTPRTSVIVTNYNLDKYLTDCLESVFRQEDKDWECIVVDDASPNKKGIEIANSYAEKDSRFKVIVNSKNVYLAEARNIAIRAAKGRYILPLDADDMLGPNALNYLANTLDADRKVHVVYGNVLFVEEDGRTA